MEINEYIKNHNDINYCEAIMFQDGSIEDAMPSHQMKLISITNKSKEEIYKLMPISADCNNWLICYNNVIAIYYNFCIFNKISDKQKQSLQLLINNGILSDNYRCIYTCEKERIELFEELKRDCDFFKLKERLNSLQKSNFIMNKNI